MTNNVSARSTIVTKKTSKPRYSLSRPKEKVSKLSSFLPFYLILLLCIGCLFIYRLDSLPKLLSINEYRFIRTPIGLHGIIHNSFYLPYKVLASALLKLFGFRVAVIRLTSVIFGLISVVCFSFLIYNWHGKRTAMLATILFGTSAWTLHVSRYASPDIIYFCATALFLLNHNIFKKYNDYPLAYLANFLTWGLLLTIPGYIYLVLLDIAWQRNELIDGWQDLNNNLVKIVSPLLVIIWIPATLHTIIKNHNLLVYLGVNKHGLTVYHFGKNFLAVFVHLFIRGPLLPGLWLGKLPVLDFFTLLLSVIGVLFYLTNYRNSRSKWLFSCFILLAILTALSVVSFASVVVLGYIFAASGLAYLLQQWLKTFPLNPYARNVGLYLLIVAVVFASFYNIRSYFIAWRYSPSVSQVFIQKP